MSQRKMHFIDLRGWKAKSRHYRCGVYQASKGGWLDGTVIREMVTCSNCLKKMAMKDHNETALINMTIHKTGFPKNFIEGLIKGAKKDGNLWDKKKQAA